MAGGKPVVLCGLWIPATLQFKAAYPGMWGSVWVDLPFPSYSPGTPMSTGTLDDATEQLGNLRMKRPNLTTAQRREALKAKLLEKGEAFDPSKWRRGKKKKKNKERQAVSTPGPTAGTKAGEGSAKRPRGTLATPPSAEGPAKKARREIQKPEAHDPEASGSTSKATYREVAAIKMAIALDGYPDAKLSEEQGAAIEDAIMEDGSVPSFAGTYLEKGVLIASCINEHTKRWLEEVIQRTKPLGDDISLRVGLRKDILRSTRVFFRAHPKLMKKTPEKVLEMFKKQNPNLNVNEWKILPSKPDPKGYGFVCFLDEVCYKAVKASNCRTLAGLNCLLDSQGQCHESYKSTYSTVGLLRQPSASSPSRRDLIWH
ncbi:hypothetical protein J6590_065793 [Homalodisca vitripennis]|nr:hypothetical protein J6590_065793 [Homalodisca vitripennis]